VFLLPAETPSRGFLQFLAFVVIAASLLGGLALPAVIRRLQLPAPNAEQERTQRHLLLTEVQGAGLRRLEEAETEGVDDRVIHRLRVNESFFLEEVDEAELEPWSRLADYARLRREMIEAERAALIAARAEGRFEEYAVRGVLAAIDAEEIVLRVTSPRAPADGPPPRRGRRAAYGRARREREEPRPR
jgi:hypothetical protein